MSASTHIIRRRRARKARQAQRDTVRRAWTILIGVVFAIGFFIPAGYAVGSAAAVYREALAALPPGDTDLVAALATMRAEQMVSGAITEFYDRDETRLLYRARDPLSAPAWTDVDTLPNHVIAATLVSEDANFLETTATDPFTFLLRLWGSLFIGGAAPDTTLTGRLVANALLYRADTGGAAVSSVARDAERSREIALVAEIERRYTRQEILEWHLNTSFYGSEAYGIETAAQTYLGKRAVDLTLAEAAWLAAIPTAPQYNPFDDVTAAGGRAADLLRAMLRAGLIDEAAFNEAVAARVVITPNPDYLPSIAPEYIALARRQAESILDAQGMDGARTVARGGLTLVTALDLDLQAQAECALDSRLAQLATPTTTIPTAVTALDGRPCLAAQGLPALSVAALTGDVAADSLPPDSGSLVVLDARTGELRALVGAAAQTDAQPGITLQPFVYFEGFNGGLGGLFTPATMVLDVPQPFPASEEGLIYSVTAPDGSFRGPMNLREAMGAGLMPPAADLAYKQGMSSILRTAHLMGINTMDENAYDLMLLERGGAVAPLDVAYAYSVFASGGDMRGVPTQSLLSGYRARDPVTILEIRDAAGAVLWAYDAAGAQTCRTLDFCTPLLEKGLAYLVNDILADAETRWSVFGRENALEMARDAAVVNGMAGDGAENWTVGYSPQWVTAVHLARADGAALAFPPYALDGSAAVWRTMMDYIHAREGQTPTGWDRPANVIEAVVCDISGLAPNGVCPTHTEIFFEGTQPRTQDTYWQRFSINNATGQLASFNTPPAQRSDARYFVPPEAALDWWRANNQPLPPTEVDTVSVPRALNAARITAPEGYSYIGETVAILGELNATNLQDYQLSYGESWNPSAWIDLGAAQTTYTPGETLGEWNTTGLDGLYSLRLLMTRDDNTVESDILLVTIDNLAPMVTLDSAEPGKIYRFPGDAAVEIVADAQDNINISRVAFYQDGDYLGADESWPYAFSWEIDAVGEATFTAIAYDAVDNEARSEFTVNVLRAGS